MHSFRSDSSKIEEILSRLRALPSDPSPGSSEVPTPADVRALHPAATPPEEGVDTEYLSAFRKACGVPRGSEIWVHWRGDGGDYRQAAEWVGKGLPGGEGYGADLADALCGKRPSPDGLAPRHIYATVRRLATAGWRFVRSEPSGMLDASCYHVWAPIEASPAAGDPGS